MVCSSFFCEASIERMLDWQYDHQGRLKEEAIDASHIVNYAEYSYHNQAKRIEVAGEVIIRSIHFNEDGTAQSVGYSANNQTTATYQYSPFSSPLESYFSVNGESVFKEENMRYDSRGYLISLTKLFQGSPQNYQYDYDAMGRLQTFQVGTSQVNYGYDNAGNLSRKSGFNRHGLSVTPLTTQSFNAQYQNKNWDYDDDGRVIDDGEFSYQYNDAGRLVLVTDKVSEEWVAHYIYDGAGNRVRKMMPDKTTYYYRNSQGNVAFEETYDNQSGELIETQRHVSQGGANVASIKQVPGQSAVVEYQFSGRLGSQSVRWTEAGEVLTQDYSPFGEQMNKADLHEGTYGFTQHEDDVDTESIYMKARHYKPIYGRMSRPDPARDFNIFNASSFNLYAYVGNNPVNAWDPTGLAESTRQVGCVQFVCSGSEAFVKDFNQAIDFALMSGAEQIVNDAAKKRGIEEGQVLTVAVEEVVDDTSHYNMTDETIYWNSNMAINNPMDSVQISPTSVLFHELGHAIDHQSAPNDQVYKDRRKVAHATYGNIVEQFAIQQLETPIAKATGQLSSELPYTRTTHEGGGFWVPMPTMKNYQFKQGIPLDFGDGVKRTRIPILALPVIKATKERRKLK